VTNPAAGVRWVAEAEARAIGIAALELGAGRRTKSDVLDLSVGIRLLAKTGARLEPGEPFAEIHAVDETRAAEAEARLRAAFRLSEEPVTPPTAEYEVIGA